MELQKLTGKKLSLLKVQKILSPAKVGNGVITKICLCLLLIKFIDCKFDTLFSLSPSTFVIYNEYINMIYFLVYGALLTSNSAVNQNEIPTALDAIRKMVTNNSGEVHSREQQSATIISGLPSSRYRSLSLSLLHKTF